MRTLTRTLRPLVLAALALALLAPGAARAESWAGLAPAITTMPQVRERLGPPSREARRKVDNYDVQEWVYEGQQAPVGFFRMTVEFGMLIKETFHPTLLRLVRLDPKPFIFTQPTVIDGWGRPDGLGEQNQRMTFFYKSGLIVIFDEDRVHAQIMLFTPPQPDLPTGAAGPAPAPAPGPAATPPAPGTPPASGGAPTPRK